MKVHDPLCIVAASLISLGFIAGATRLFLVGHWIPASVFTVLALATAPRWY